MNCTFEEFELHVRKVAAPGVLRPIACAFWGHYYPDFYWTLNFTDCNSVRLRVCKKCGHVDIFPSRYFNRSR